MPELSYPHSKKNHQCVYWWSNGTSCISICAHCLLSWQQKDGFFLPLLFFCSIFYFIFILSFLNYPNHVAYFFPLSGYRKILQDYVSAKARSPKPKGYEVASAWLTSTGHNSIYFYDLQPYSDFNMVHLTKLWQNPTQVFKVILGFHCHQTVSLNWLIKQIGSLQHLQGKVDFPI